MPQLPDTSRKPVIGLMGGPGSGKSTIAKLFSEFGCSVIDADRLSHEALQSEQVKQEIKAKWGDAVFDEAGQIIRGALGQIVFSDPAALRQLEAIIHPLVHQGRARQRQSHQNDASIVAIIEDCPLLLESELDQSCDYLVFIDVPEDIRLQRVQDTRGWDAAELKKRDDQQLPLDTKRQAADYVIRNDQDLAHVREQVRHVLQTIIHDSP